MADGKARLSGDQMSVLWGLAFSRVMMGQPATLDQVAESMARAEAPGDRDFIETQLESMVEFGVVERHDLETGVGFAMTLKGSDTLGI
jgi:RIO-like serine/threonine protein kinase